MDHRTYSGRGPRPVHHNPTAQTTTTPLFDADGNIVSMVEEQPRSMVEHAAELAKMANAHALDLKGGTQRHMRLAAEIPNIFVNDLMRRGIWQDTDRLLQWIEEEAPRDFRAYAGKLR